MNINLRTMKSLPQMGTAMVIATASLKTPQYLPVTGSGLPFWLQAELDSEETVLFGLAFRFSSNVEDPCLE